MEAYLNDVCSRYRGLHLAVRLRAAADGLTGDAQARALGLALDELKRATRATELYKLLAARTGATTYHACVHGRMATAWRGCARSSNGGHDHAADASIEPTRGAMRATAHRNPRHVPIVRPLLTRYRCCLPLARSYDAAWVEAEERSTVALRAIVERQINTETTNMIRENIRVSGAVGALACGSDIGAVEGVPRSRALTNPIIDTLPSRALCSVRTWTWRRCRWTAATWWAPFGRGAWRGLGRPAGVREYVREPRPVTGSLSTPPHSSIVATLPHTQVALPRVHHHRQADGRVQRGHDGGGGAGAAVAGGGADGGPPRRRHGGVRQPAVRLQRRLTGWG